MEIFDADVPVAEAFERPAAALQTTRVSAADPAKFTPPQLPPPGVQAKPMLLVVRPGEAAGA